MYSSYSLSDKGLARLNNEDCYGNVEAKHFYALADGLGGKNGGEIASTQTIENLCKEIANNPLFSNQTQDEKKILQNLLEAIHLTNYKVWEMSQKDSALQGMGTTLTCALFIQGLCIFAHAGDSRLYRLRENQLEQLTHDDSLVSDLLQFGLLDEEESKKFPLKHVITKSIGGYDEITPSFGILPLQKGDLYLLSSDGLHGFVSDDKIKKIITSNLPLKEKAEKLLCKALDAGGLEVNTLSSRQLLDKKLVLDDHRLE